MEGGGEGRKITEVVVCWLRSVSATFLCMSRTALLRQLYMLPH